MSKSINPMLFLNPEAKPFRGFAPVPSFLMSLRPAIPWRVALQHCPPPLHRPVSIFRPPKVICQPSPSGRISPGLERPAKANY